MDGVVREAERARLAAETARARLTAGHRVVVPEFGRVDRPVDDPAMGFGGQQQQGYGWAPRPVDYLKPFSRLRVDTFNGTIGSDVESWFTRLEAAFHQLKTPDEHWVRLAETCLKGDAFDEWHSRRTERVS